jgi:hypothetical protein
MPYVFGDIDGEEGIILAPGVAQKQRFRITQESEDQYVGDSYTISDFGVGARDRFSLAHDTSGSFIGDAVQMLGSAHGGNDRFFGGLSTSVVGDAIYMTDDAIGGNDTFVDRRASSGGSVAGYGDAVFLFGRARGGNDQMEGADLAVANELVGDAEQIFDLASGGDDTLQGGNSNVVDWENGNATINLIIGDAFNVGAVADLLISQAQNALGSDILYGGDFSIDRLYGDALSVVADGVISCGDDLIEAGDGGSSTIYGDLEEAGTGSTVLCGSDTIIGGTGNDVMFGDFANGEDADVTRGADVFVFKPNFGSDVISDLEIGVDVIDLSAAFAPAPGEPYSFVIGAIGNDSVVQVGGSGLSYSGNILILNTAIDGSSLLSTTDFVL